MDKQTRIQRVRIILSIVSANLVVTLIDLFNINFFSIPSLYYKPNDGGEFICSGPDNHGLHKCSG